MKLKKLLATATATALALTTMVTTSFTSVSAAVIFNDTTGTGWDQGTFFTNSSAEFSDVDLIGVNKLTFNANVTDLHWGWNNGFFTTNSNGAGWQQVSFGGVESDVAVVLEDVGPFSVDVEVGVTDGWFEAGWATGTADEVFSLVSVDFYRDNEKVGTWADGSYKSADEMDDTTGGDDTTGDTASGTFELVDDGTGEWYMVETTYGAVTGGLDASKATITFTFDVEDGAYSSVGYSANEEHGWWNESVAIDNVAILTPEDYAIVASGLGTYMKIGSSSPGTVTWVAKVEGSSGPSVDDPNVGDPGTDEPETPDDNTTTNDDPFSDPVNYKPAPAAAPAGATVATSAETAVNTITEASDGSKTTVSLTSGSTQLDKTVLAALAGKDVTVKFTLPGGVYWEINGTNIDSAKKVDLGVRVDRSNIPSDKITELAGDKKTVELSLKHSGDFGFTGVLNVPMSPKYNGQYGNLYYYNNGKFDFIGSSEISGGNVGFRFSHASDYVIVVDTYAYGEDVSAAAGVYESSNEVSAFSAILVVIAAFGISAAVLKKRLAK